MPLSAPLNSGSLDRSTIRAYSYFLRVSADMISLQTNRLLVSKPEFRSNDPANAPELLIDPSWREFIEPITRLKDAIDVAGRWPEVAKKSDWVRITLANAGLTEQGIGKIGHAALPQFPDHFLKILFGRWIWGVDGESCGWYLIPEWATLGWVRKYESIATVCPMVAQSEASDLDRAVQQGISDNTTYCVGGIPLLYAGEGKNRASLQRRGSVLRRSILKFVPLALENIVVHKLAWRSDILIAQTVAEGRRVIPIGTTVAPLFAAMGIRTSDSPSVVGWFTVITALKAKGLTFHAIVKILWGPKSGLLEQLLRNDI